MVTVDTTAEEAAARAEDDVPYLLVTDREGRPLGWSEPAALAAGPVDVIRLLPHGRPFRHGEESLRAALDCAVLSPTGWAVAVDGTGRAVGIVSQQAIGEAIRTAHAGRTTGADDGDGTAPGDADAATGAEVAG
jgi:osmoprotectant transport system ATP-binding protein